MKKKEMKHVSIRIDPHIYRIIQQTSLKENISFSGLMREVLRYGVKNMECVELLELKREVNREEKSYKLTRTLRSAESVPELIRRFIDLCRKGVNEHLIRQFVIDGMELIKTYDNYDILLNELQFLKEIVEDRIKLYMTIDYIIKHQEPDILFKQKIISGELSWIQI